MYRPSSTRNKHKVPYQRQTGFVLMSVLFITILIGIITLYNARLDQKIARVERIQLTAERMNQWLEAASAYYRVNGSSWPTTLDVTRQMGTDSVSQDGFYSIHTDDFQKRDLAATYFMPASIEDYQDNAGCNSNQDQTITADVSQSPTATAWANSSSTCPNDTASAYLIRADLDPACFNPNNDQSDNDQPAECQFDHPGERFGIVAQVPSRAIAEAIAAKLPNSDIQQNPTIKDGKHWMVHMAVPIDPTQSQDNTPGPGKFTSGYLPIQDSSNQNQGTSAFSYSYGENGYLGINANQISGNTYQYGNVSFDSNDSNDSNIVNQLLYGSKSETTSNYKYNLVNNSFLINHIQYNTNDNGNDGTFFNSCNGVNNGYPNLVVSASGFQAPPDIQQVYGNNLQNTFSSQNQSITNPAKINLFLDNCGTDQYNLDPTTDKPTSRPMCTDFYPYSSLYGIETIAFAQTNTQNQKTDTFYLIAMGMSTQASGNNGSDSLSITNSLKERNASSVLNTCTLKPGDSKITCPPTMGIFPGDNNSDDTETLKNKNHYWAERQLYHKADGNGILGLNYFFFCNPVTQN